MPSWWKMGCVCTICEKQRRESLEYRQSLPVGGLSCPERFGEPHAVQLQGDVSLNDCWKLLRRLCSGFRSMPDHLRRCHDEMSPLQEQIYKNFEEDGGLPL